MGDVLNFIGDRLTSLVASLGTSRDKGASLSYAAPLLTDVEILNAYRSAWLPRKIVDIPAFDSCRKWRSWQAKKDQIEAIEAEEIRLNLKGKILEARIKARLFGGAAVFMATRDQDFSQALTPESVAKGGLLYLTVFTRVQLSAGEIDRDPSSEWYGRPKEYKVATVGNAQELRIHPSRLVVFIGNQIPDDQTAASGQQGWGDSVLTAVMDAIKQADGTAANIASLIFEAKIDVIRIPDFMLKLGDKAYEAKLVSRYTNAAIAKGNNGMLLLDKDEEYEQKSANFATLPDILMAFMQIVSGAADIPATRLLGQAPGGLNATGDSDLVNYYDRIQAGQELEMQPAMMRLDECLIRSATGTRDPSIYYVWQPLWQLTEKERAENAQKKAETAAKLVDSGLIPLDALAKGVQNQLIEDGSLPGLEAALEESTQAIEAGQAQRKKPEEQDAEGNVIPLRPKQQAADALPRTLYVRRDVKNAADIIAWAKAQGFETTLPASDLHVTIAFSRTPVDWMAVGESWSSELKVAAGGPRIMERFGDATVLLFKASDLEWRHKAIDEIGASWDHPEYQPHITISYGDRRPLAEIEPYQGEIVLGPEIFEEVKEDWQASISEE